MNDDLISRQALMKEFSDFVRASNSSDFAQTPTWNDAVSLVGSMPSAQQQDIARDIATIIENEKDMRVVLKQPRWIPCSERLPKAGEYIGDVARYYLVQNEYGDMLVARYTHSEYWEQIYQSKPYADEIVAWMPLPEPYKGEESCQDTLTQIRYQDTARGAESVTGRR